MVVNVAGAIGFAILLADEGLAHVGIAAATSLAGWVNALLSVHGARAAGGLPRRCNGRLARPRLSRRIAGADDRRNADRAGARRLVLRVRHDDRGAGPADPGGRLGERSSRSSARRPVPWACATSCAPSAGVEGAPRRTLVADRPTPGCARRTGRAGAARRPRTTSASRRSARPPARRGGRASRR